MHQKFPFRSGEALDVMVAFQEPEEAGNFFDFPVCFGEYFLTEKKDISGEQGRHNLPELPLPPDFQHTAGENHLKGQCGPVLFRKGHKLCLVSGLNLYGVVIHGNTSKYHTDSIL